MGRTSPFRMEDSAPGAPLRAENTAAARNRAQSATRPLIPFHAVCCKGNRRAARSLAPIWPPRDDSGGTHYNGPHLTDAARLLEDTMAQDLSVPDPAIVLDLLQAFRRSKTMFAAVKLGVFDALA